MDSFQSFARGSRHVDQSQGSETYDMDVYATSYSSAHNIPKFKPKPPLLRDCTGFIHSLVPSAEFGVLAPASVRRLTSQLYRSALPERHPAWVMHDGREPMPATITSSDGGSAAAAGSGYASNATPTHQIVKTPRSWRQSAGTPSCLLHDQQQRLDPHVKNPLVDYVSETQSIFKRKPFHTDLRGTSTPADPAVPCDSGFSHERGAEGGPQARHFQTLPTVYQSEYPPRHLGPPDRLPSNNNDTSDVGTGYPHHRAVLVGGILHPPLTKYQADFGPPRSKRTTDHLVPTLISSSGFHSNNRIKELQVERRNFCTDYADGFSDPSRQGAAREGHTAGNIIAHTQTYYPMSAFRHRHRGGGGDDPPPGCQAYVTRSWGARNAPGTIGTQRVDESLREIAV